MHTLLLLALLSCGKDPGDSAADAPPRGAAPGDTGDSGGDGAVSGPGDRGEDSADDSGAAGGDGGGGDGGGDGGGGGSCEVRIELIRVLAETGELPWPLSGASPSTHYLSVDRTPPADGERLYFYADYYMYGYSLSEQFEFFLFPLNGEYCTLAGTVDLEGEPLVSAPLYDVTAGAPERVEQAAPGGAGELNTDVGAGVNVWDITDIDLIDSDCGATPLESLDYSAHYAYALFWHYYGYGAQVRAFRIYAGVEVCE